jgi:glycosyltransferase involved in cell wall biosynthesis
MAAALKRLLTDQSLYKQLLAGRDAHLSQFQPETIARRYLKIFASVLKNDDREPAYESSDPQH